MKERDHLRVRRGTRCEIIVVGELDTRFASAFDEMTVYAEDGRTHIVGEVIDQSQLLGLLERIAGLGIGFGQPMTVTFVASRATKADRATALAVRLTANRLSLLFVPAALGIAAGAAGVDLVFWILAGILAAGSAVAATSRLEASGGEARAGGEAGPATGIEPAAGDRGGRR